MSKPTCISLGKGKQSKYDNEEDVFKSRMEEEVVAGEMAVRVFWGTEGMRTSEWVTERVLREDKSHSTGLTMSDPQIMVPNEP